jgi:hypothetical protein
MGGTTVGCVLEGTSEGSSSQSAPNAHPNNNRRAAIEMP